jgi:hypothetical protein
MSSVSSRWGNPNGHAWGEYPCGGILAGEVDFGGIKLPTQMRAGWFFERHRPSTPAPSA